MNPIQETIAYKVHKADGYGIRKETTNDGSGHWFQGAVRTRHCYVMVYAEAGHVALSLIHDGYDVTRYLKFKKPTQRGLVTMARRFAEEIFV